MSKKEEKRDRKRDKARRPGRCSACVQSNRPTELALDQVIFDDVPSGQLSWMEWMSEHEQIPRARLSPDDGIDWFASCLTMDDGKSKSHATHSYDTPPLVFIDKYLAKTQLFIRNSKLGANFSSLFLLFIYKVRALEGWILGRGWWWTARI
jgi:hypothetical protein